MALNHKDLETNKNLRLAAICQFLLLLVALVAVAFRELPRYVLGFGYNSLVIYIPLILFRLAGLIFVRIALRATTSRVLLVLSGLFDFGVLAIAGFDLLKTYNYWPLAARAVNKLNMIIWFYVFPVLDPQELYYLILAALALLFGCLLWRKSKKAL